MKIWLELDGIACTGAVSAPGAARALAALLPWSATAVHDIWSGHVLYVSEACRLPLDDPAAEPRSNLFAGELAYHPEDRRLLIGYDFGQFRTGPGRVSQVRLLGRLDREHAGYARWLERARGLQADGQRPLVMRPA